MPYASLDKLGGDVVPPRSTKIWPVQSGAPPLALSNALKPGQAELANPIFLWVLPVSDGVQLVDLALALLVQDSFEA
jgi:hypothetical protein